MAWASSEEAGLAFTSRTDLAYSVSHCRRNVIQSQHSWTLWASVQLTVGASTHARSIFQEAGSGLASRCQCQSCPLRLAHKGCWGPVSLPPLFPASSPKQDQALFLRMPSPGGWQISQPRSPEHSDFDGAQASEQSEAPFLMPWWLQVTG